jgi:hypothetical protein
MKLVLQINDKAINDTGRALADRGFSITPPLNEDFWLFRVAVSEDQAIVGFPKFMQIGIGFQKEAADWNTNLPSTCDAKMIYEHIEVNKGQEPKRQDCIKAIEMIKDFVAQMDRAAAAKAEAEATLEVPARA